MNRIPNPTNIMSTPYKVNFVEELADDNGCQLFGQTDFVKSRINLTNGMPKQLKEKTWVHEMLHGICREINLKLTENELDTLANALYDTLVRNKCNFTV